MDNSVDSVLGLLPNNYQFESHQGYRRFTRSLTSRPRGISRGTHKLVRISTVIKKKKKRSIWSKILIYHTIHMDYQMASQIFPTILKEHTSSINFKVQDNHSLTSSQALTLHHSMRGIPTMKTHPSISIPFYHHIHSSTTSITMPPPPQLPQSHPAQLAFLSPLF